MGHGNATALVGPVPVLSLLGRKEHSCWWSPSCGSDFTMTASSGVKDGVLLVCIFGLAVPLEWAVLSLGMYCWVLSAGWHRPEPRQPQASPSYRKTRTLVTISVLASSARGFCRGLEPAESIHSSCRRWVASTLRWEQRQLAVHCWLQLLAMVSW